MKNIHCTTRNQNLVHIWVVWKRKSKRWTARANTVSAFFWLNYLDYEPRAHTHTHVEWTKLRRECSSWQFVCSFSIDSSTFSSIYKISLSLSFYLSSSLFLSIVLIPSFCSSPTHRLIRLLIRPLVCSFIQSQSFRWQPANWTNLSLFILFISCIWKLIYCSHFGISVLT